MNFYVLTLFPELIQSIVNTSITGRAIRKGCLGVETINIRDFSTNRTRRVDDYPYGGGAGMVMEAEPVYQAVQHAKTRAGSGTRVVYLTPQAEVLTQTKVEELAREQNLILLCGHYEGIDERVLEETVTDYVSIGDYVLTGGELGAAVLIDAVSRFVPGVLSNEESSQFESMQDNLLEYPQYTRPETWHDRQVPEVLLCGDHSRIEAWRHEQSVERTKERRPDLLEKSYRTIGIFWEEGRVQEIEKKIVDDISRYALEWDYSRRKLQKTRTACGRNDLAVFVFSGKDEEPAFGERFRNLRGDGTPAVCIQIMPDSRREQNQVEEADTFLNDESQWNMAMIRAEMCLEKAGFRVMTTTSLDENASDDDISETALRIRQKLLHFEE